MSISAIIKEEIKNYEHTNYQKLLEIGEGGHQAYPWVAVTETPELEYEYVFYTEDQDKYIVGFDNIGNFWNIEFRIENQNFEQIVDKGRFFNIMATVGELIKMFLIKESPELIRISPSKNSNADRRRFNIYKQYLERQAPEGYEVSASGGYIYMTKVDELQAVAEGVGDKYAQQYGVPDAGEEFQKQYQQHLKVRSQTPENGQLVGEVRGNDNIVVNIYMNPTSLKNFEPSVRAFSDNNNNLFVAQLDTSIIHNTMGKALQIGNVLDTNQYIPWIRAGKSDKFMLSFNFMDMYDEARHDESQEIGPRVAVLNTKHPFSFHMMPT